jgi:hypothetical protein
MGILLGLYKKYVKSQKMRNVGMQTRGFSQFTDASVCVCVCVRARASVCVRAHTWEEGVFSLFMEFSTCYIDCGINICVYQQNPQQFDLVVMQWENNTTGSHSN